jgi:hypothetical protein
MTIKELKEKLDQFPDNLIVMIPNNDYPWSAPAMNVSRGCNEADGCVFIYSYEEDEE